MKLLPQTLLLAAIGLADLVSTLLLVGRFGAAEANPLMAPLLRHSPLLFAAVKVATLTLSLLALEWSRRRRPLLVRRAMSAALVAYLALYVAGVARANWTPDIRHDPGTSPLQQKLWAEIEERIRRAPRTPDTATGRLAAGRAPLDA